MVDFSRHRYRLVVLACLQSVLISGIFYGWPSLETLIIESNSLQYLCLDQPDPTVVCPAVKTRLRTIFASASTANLLAQLPTGFLLDFAGPKLCCGICSLVVTLCMLLLSSGFPSFILPAIVAMAAAGPGVQISLFHLAELFPGRKSSVLSIMAGAFQLSMAVFMVLLWLSHQFFASIHVVLAWYSALLLIITFIGIIVWPGRPLLALDDYDPIAFQLQPSPSIATLISVPFNDFDDIPYTGRHPLDYSADDLNHSNLFETSGSYQSYHMPDDASTGTKSELDWTPIRARSSRSPIRIPSPPPSDFDHFSQPSGHQLSPLQQPLLSARPLHPQHHLSHSTPMHPSHAADRLRRADLIAQVTSTQFIICCVWMSVCVVIANSYLGNVVEQLYTKSGHDITKTRHMTALFNLSLPIGAIFIPIFGSCTDRLGFFAGACLLVILSISLTLSSQLPLEWQLLAFLSYSFFRTCLFSMMFAYLRHRFGFRWFGAVTGFTLAASSVLFASVNAMQPQLLNHSVAEEDQPQLLVMSASCLLFALYVAFTERHDFIPEY